MQLELFTDLKGQTLSHVEIKQDEEIIFTLKDGRKYKLFHYQDCCETVSIKDIVGDIPDLIGHEILQADEASNEDKTYYKDKGPDCSDSESYTWTFYNIATILGSVSITWFGESNGYYSESVEFAEVNPDDDD